MSETVKEQHPVGIARFFAVNWQELFFWGVLLAFVIETVWIALHAAFPMAFDEGYHVGVIRFFAQHTNPVVTTQDPSTYIYGNIVHNSSWLYHWLLSFPYRILAMTHSAYIEVVGLRFINIGMAVGSLALLHRLLRHLRLSSNIRTFIMLLLGFTPVFTALSSQVNYDNLVVLLTTAAAYYMLFFIRELGVKKPSAKTFAKLFAVCLLGSLVKFSFLPIFAGVFIIVSVAWFRQFRRGTHPWKRLVHSFTSLSNRASAVVILATICSAGLFVAYYGQNLVRYHNLTPSCDQVLSANACSNYYAWERNYQLSQHFDPSTPLQNPLVYSYHWAVTSWYHLYAEIVPTGGIVHIARSFYILLLAITGLAVLVTLFHFRMVVQRYPLLVPLVWLSVIYTLGLWARNYHDYRHFGEAVAVQGRYLVPVLGFYYTLLALGVHTAFTRAAKPAAWLRNIEFGVAVGVVLVFLAYGGAVRYVSNILPANNWHTTTRVE